MHVRRMHSAARHSTRLPPPNDMLQEDESELNVMDFVETEYKSDAGPGEQGRPGGKRKKARSKVQGSQGKGRAANKSKGEQEPPAEGGKTVHKRRKKKHTHRPGEASTTQANLGLYYPYAAFLKNLCDKVGSSQGGPDALPTKIFNQLRHTDVHYPYASLLQALHRHARVVARGASSPSTARTAQDQPARTLEVAKVMKNLCYPTASHRHNGREDAAAPVTPFSSVLMAIVMQEKVNANTEDDAGCGHTVGTIGDILRKEMPHSKKDDLPPSELSSASLLQKLSLSAEQDLQAAKGGGSLPGTQQASTCSSSQSSHSEEEDVDWRPAHWLAKEVTKEADAPGNRKSIRKKKSLSSDLEPEQPNTSEGAVSAGLHHCSTSEAARAKLLHFIMSRQQRTSDKKGKRTRKRAKASKKKGKRKHVNTSQKSDTLWDTELTATSLTEGQTTLLEGEDTHLAPGEPQSLLKEYLLKPAGEEVVPSENCDIPKLETNFLFSRLLQNFKCLAESNQPDEPSKKTSESSRGPSILRGMLAAGTTLDDEEGKFSPSDLQNTSSSSSEQQQQGSTASPLGEPLVMVKMEQEIKVECDGEEIVCKYECAEDDFECQVCHLQFSSLTDLSNHQVLFHCSEEAPPPGSHRLLGCSVEGLSGGVMQGKQPA